jgi:hypothetical protein
MGPKLHNTSHRLMHGRRDPSMFESAHTHESGAMKETVVPAREGNGWEIGLVLPMAEVDPANSFPRFRLFSFALMLYDLMQKKNHVPTELWI